MCLDQSKNHSGPEKDRERDQKRARKGIEQKQIQKRDVNSVAQ